MGEWLASRRWWRWQTAAAVSGLMLSGAVLVDSVTARLDESNEHANDRTLREELARATYEQECRYELSLPVTEAQAMKLDALALGLVAAARDDDAGLADQLVRIEEASAAEQEALEARADAVETCDQQAEEIYGP